MERRDSVALVLALFVAFGARGSAAQASGDSTVALVIAAGRPLRVALDERVRLKQVGQPVTATLVESVYAFDRIVVPVGTKVLGQVEALEGVSKKTRIAAMAGGDFTPLRVATLRFDRLVLGDGREIRMTTRVTGSTPNVALHVTPPSGTSPVARARDAARQKVRDTLAPFKQPGKMARLKYMAIARLPYHPQYLAKGIVYTVSLVEPLNFGSVTATEWAPPGTPPPPQTVLTARLLTRLDSAKTPRDTPIQAALIEPLLSEDGRLILPEGTTLNGSVTFATHARRFRRNGQLRFLFESVQLPAGGPEKLLASLHSTELSRDDHLAIDEEGGVRVTNPKTRFIGPAFGVFAVHAALGQDVKYDAGEIGNATDIPGPNIGGRAIGGFFGLGFLGAAVGQISRPVAGSLAFVGLAQTVYSNLLARGKEVIFPSDTTIQLQLSPASTKK